MYTVDPIEIESREARAVTAAEFRSTCALFPTGVTIVTRRMRDGRPYGMTVSSFTSLSLHPPLILICVDRGSGFVADLAPGVAFAVNLLREDQQELAVRFARQPELGRFSSLSWDTAPDGVPLLRDTIGAFRCQAAEVLPGGDHLICVGAVNEVRRHPGRPLVWCDSAYCCLPQRSF